MCICSTLWNSACLWSPRQLNPGPKGLDPAGRAPTSDKRWGLRLGSQQPRSVSARKQTVTAPGGHHRVQDSMSRICDIKGHLISDSKRLSLSFFKILEAQCTGKGWPACPNHCQLGQAGGRTQEVGRPAPPPPTTTVELPVELPVKLWSRGQFAY